MREDNFEMYKSFVAFCKAVGCPGITISSGIIYKDEGQDYEAAYEISRDEVRRMVDYGGQYDVELRPEPHSESMMGTLEKCQRMLDDVPGLMASLDYSHFMPQGHTEEEVDVLIPRAGHVHAREANRERLQCRMEDGILDFDHILGALKKDGYNGNVTLEYIFVNYCGCYDVDVIIETLKLKQELEGYLSCALISALPERVAIITGAARGLGAATAQLFARFGAHVVACDIDGDELEKTVSDLEGEGHIALAFDLSRPENCESLVAQTMERFGRLDI